MQLTPTSESPAPKALTVGAFNRKVKALLEGGLPECWIRGEISNLRRQSSGHIYFTLKDHESQLSCVLFRADALRQSVDLRDGGSVQVLGEVSLYLPRGTHQLVCREVVDDGLGRLQIAFERLKRKLADEGLFAPERKKTLPSLARRVGFVTSASGAAWRDFASILQRLEWGGEAILFPAQVQGDAGAASIVNAIAQASQWPLDLLVVGRGGGSLEDLWNFNEETVVRYVAGCPLPTLSAVGHEIDVTLCDFAADARAETPSAAAERIATAQSRLREQSRQLADDFKSECARQRLRLTDELARLQQRMRVQTPARHLQEAAQRVDEASNRLIVGRAMTLNPLRARADSASQGLRLIRPGERLRRAQGVGDDLRHRLRHALRNHLNQRNDRHRNLAGRLEQAGLSQALRRGFVIVKDTRGRFVKSRERLRPGQGIVLSFADGEATAKVLDTHPEVPPPEQHELF